VICAEKNSGWMSAAVAAGVSMKSPVRFTMIAEGNE
jgi:hypothetical protein